MHYWARRLWERLREKMWTPYERYASDDVVAYIYDFEKPVPGWHGGFVACKTTQYYAMGCMGYTGVSIVADVRDDHGKKVHRESFEMLTAGNDNIIAREAYEKMRTSKLWRWRWRTFGRKIEMPSQQRKINQALIASFAMIPPPRKRKA